MKTKCAVCVPEVRSDPFADARDSSGDHGEFNLNGHYLLVLTFECRHANETLQMIFGAACLQTSLT